MTSSGTGPVDFKQLVKAEYMALVQSGMEKNEAAKEAIRRVKERQLQGGSDPK